MNIKRITAIVPIDIVETLEKNLRARGVPASLSNTYRDLASIQTFSVVIS
jgi:hypothetical protein